MFDLIPLARTRLEVPPLAAQSLPRPRLQARLQTLCRLRAVSVQAGAGFGKSSLLSSWAASRSAPTAWYSVAERDDDVFTFLAHWLGALEVCLQAPWVRPAAVRLRDEGVAGNRWRAVADMCINGLLDVGQVAIVIDDAHHLQQAEVLEVLSYLLQYLPSGVCLVMSSRRPPTLSAWNGLLLRGQVAAIEADELALDADEVEAMTALRRGTAADAAEVAAVRERSGGWPLAADFLVRSQSSPVGQLDEYITSEIWSLLSEPDREFLLRCSVLDGLWPEVCAAVCERPQAGDVLRRLQREGVFLQPLGQGGYRIHQLFADFLSARLQEKPELARASHLKAAEVLIGQSRPLEAVEHYVICGGDAIPLAAFVLRQSGPRLLAQGQHRRLLAMIDSLGAEPDLLLQRYRADALRQAGAFEAAVAAFSSLHRQAESAGDVAMQAASLSGLGRVYVDTLQPIRAQTVLRQAFRLMPSTQTDDRATLLELMAENYLNQGRVSAALHFRRWARSLPQRSHADVLDARLLLRTGQLHAARAMLRGQMDVAQTAHDGGHREGVLILSYIAALEGDAEEAERRARAGLEVAEQAASVSTEAVAWMRLGHALQLREEPPFEEAIRAYSRALTLATETGVERLRAEALMGMALLHARGGDVPRSYACATDGLAITRTAGDAWLSAWLRLVCGIAALRGGHPDAPSILREALSEMEVCHDTFGIAVTALWMDGTNAAEHARERGYGFLLQRKTLFGPPPPADAPAVPPPMLEKDTLRVQTLGTLHVWREGVQVEAKAWKREKARELFLILLTRRGTACHKETLMEMLWPEGQAAAADRDFRVAMHALSQALDPDRPKNAPARWMERRGSSYLLSSGQHLVVDVDEFEHLVEMANAHTDRSAAMPLWRRALGLYRGDYLEEFPYNEWSDEERERLRSLFLTTAERLAHACEQSGDDEGAIQTAHEILRRDKCWEAAYRILIGVYLKQGRSHLAARTYEQCVQALEEELGIEPSEETSALMEAVR